jgi:hypothetical protein
MENSMKRLIVSAITVVVLSLASGLPSVAQSAPAEGPSLGDFARAVRKSRPQEVKPAEKVYDNDNIASATSVSVVGNSSAASDSSNTTETKGNNGASGNQNAQPESKTQNDDPPKVSPGQSREDRQKVFDSWKQRIDDQKHKIDQLSQEISGLKNVNNSQVSVWPDQKYAQTLTDKQKALDDAKAGLSDLQEQARKAGVPSSFTE